jgi:hypothetical protein
MKLFFWIAIPASIGVMYLLYRQGGFAEVGCLICFVGLLNAGALAKIIIKLFK